MKYSIILSTLGERETLTKCLNNFMSFMSAREDTELVIATNNHNMNFYHPRLKMVWVQKRQGIQLMWQEAALAAKGDILVKVDDDLMLSKNFLDRCDLLFTDQIMMVHPLLLDAEGYVLLTEQLPNYSYSIGAMRRRQALEIGFGSGSGEDLKVIRGLYEKYPKGILFDRESYCLHYGYPGVKGGINSTLAHYTNPDGTPGYFITHWIPEQRKLNGNRQINVEENFTY